MAIQEFYTVNFNIKYDKVNRYYMEKKKYIKPEMKEIKLHQERSLLQGSYDDGEMGSIISSDINKQV